MFGLLVPTRALLCGNDASRSWLSFGHVPAPFSGPELPSVSARGCRSRFWVGILNGTRFCGENDECLDSTLIECEDATRVASVDMVWSIVEDPDTCFEHPDPLVLLFGVLILYFPSPVCSATKVVKEATRLNSDLLSFEIQMPSTSTPLCSALTPNGISFCRLVWIPQCLISSVRARFSSSSISSFRTCRFVRHSLTSPRPKTTTMQHARTCK
jgi:hypothetical protein